MSFYLVLWSHRRRERRRMSLLAKTDGLWITLAGWLASVFATSCDLSHCRKFQPF
jgi:hypothetical protein